MKQLAHLAMMENPIVFSLEDYTRSVSLQSAKVCGIALAGMAHLVGALSYKLKGHGFDSP